MTRSVLLKHLAKVARCPATRHPAWSRFVRYLELGGVPARQSVYELPGIAEEYTFVPALVESWQEGVPEFRPRFAEWPQITEIVQEWGTRMMLGEVSVEEGAREIGTRMEEVLDDAGYYSGDKPLAQ